jgi:hypothetical protein
MGTEVLPENLKGTDSWETRRRWEDNINKDVREIYQNALDASS